MKTNADRAHDFMEDWRGGQILSVEKTLAVLLDQAEDRGREQVGSLEAARFDGRRDGMIEAALMVARGAGVPVDVQDNTRLAALVAKAILAEAFKP